MDARRDRRAGAARARRRPHLARHRRPGADRRRGGGARSACHTRSTPPRRRARPTSASSARAFDARRACRTRAWTRGRHGPAAGARVVVKPAAAQGQRGLDDRRSASGDWPTAVARAAGGLARRARARARSSSRARSSPSTRSSHGGRFVPLTVTDRERALARSASPRRTSTRSLDPDRGSVVAAARAACRGARHRRPGRPTRRSCSAPDGPRVMEVAARLGGGHDGELCAAALGVDLSASRPCWRPSLRRCPPARLERGARAGRPSCAS